jgi:deoxycytidine triphosphate deaminase
MKKEKEERKEKEIKLIAKRDHVIFQNKEKYIIKKGEEIKVPKRFLETLKAEKVI